MDEFQVLALVNTAVILVVAVNLLLNDALVETFENAPGKSFLVTDKDGNIEHLSMEAMERAINSIHTSIKSSGIAYDDAMRKLPFTRANFPNIHATVSNDLNSANGTINAKMTNTIWNGRINDREDASKLANSIRSGHSKWVTVRAANTACLFNAGDWGDRKGKFEGGDKCRRDEHGGGRENSGMRVAFKDPAPYPD